VHLPFILAFARVTVLFKALFIIDCRYNVAQSEPLTLWIQTIYKC